VVVIGGGIMGASAAFHLAEAGVPDVLLVERGQLASGSTSRAAGGVRAQFSDALNIEIARRSLEAWADFGTRPGWEIDFRQVGYLFLLTRPEDAALFERSVRLQNELGVPSRMVSALEAKRLSPLLEVGDVVAASFSPSDGHVTPEAAVHGYAGAARALGARIVTGCEVTDIEMTGADVSAVVTSAGRVACGAVICAAGAWSRACGEMVGVDLPVTPVRRQVMFTEPIESLPAELPMTIDFTTSFYFHREGPGLLVGMSHEDDPVSFGAETNDAWAAGLLEAADRERGDERRMVGALRDEPRPQRADRRVAERLALPVRDRLLGPRPSAGPRRRRDPARPLPRTRALRRRDAALRDALRSRRRAARVQRRVDDP
jgi:sarcosine oxidase subunit beta